MRHLKAEIFIILIVFFVALIGTILNMDVFNYTDNITGNAYKTVNSRIESQIVPNAVCGDIIKRSIQINQDLVCPGSGIIIGNDNVIVDCGNHIISYASLNNGYGIKNEGYDNVEIKNCEIVTESKNMDNSGVYIKDAKNSNIHDNIIKTTNNKGIDMLNSDGVIINNEIQSWAGIYFIYGDDINIRNNNIATSKGNGFGIAGKIYSGGDVIENHITTKADGSTGIMLEGSNWVIDSNYVDSNGTGIAVMWGEKNSIINNEIITDYPYQGSGYGLNILEVSDSVISGNDITTSGNDWAYGMKLWWVSESLMEDNTIDSEDSYAFFLWDSNYNVIKNNEVVRAVEGVHMKPFDANCDNNILMSNVFGDISKVDLYLGRDGFGGSDNTQIVNQRIRKYEIVKSAIFLENDYGAVEYLNPISASGNNLDEDIKIIKNSISVDKEGLSEMAELTFKDLSFLNPVALMNGNVCPSDICGVVSLQGDDYSYTVEHFTEYSLGNN